MVLFLFSLLIYFSPFQRPAPPTFDPPPKSAAKPKPPTLIPLPEPPGEVHTDKEPPLKKGEKAPQGKQTATLRWRDNNEPDPSDSFNIWRSDGECGQYPQLVKIKTGVVGTSYVDSTIRPNRPYCYAVSSIYKGEESAQSIPATATPPKTTGKK